MQTKEIAGKQVQVDEDGFLVNPNDWTREIAQALAAEQGIDVLTEAHWRVIEFMRADFAEKGAVPTIRRLSKVGGIETKELYELFPNGPAKKAARIAGLGKPQGCV
ncbi:MAG TPA: TusE/DsrC/DsvC family sulfur relay protein [bacterium]|jgi:tRNA 2-thiouridine synthesizing protein E|nr:TusE/DsrC/DsvC family sulfur relay protein [bacterium]HPG44361.1 TusE/DsrC/DsvC family sulfur relay protein [bacterium]HPM96919.1 TusE/DsrC/DsvC family sulfur relay protein [bacterium]